MGPVRSRHAVRLLSAAVAVNLVVGVAVLHVRAGEAAGGPAKDVQAGRATGPAGGGGILAGGTFSHRRPVTGTTSRATPRATSPATGASTAAPATGSSAVTPSAGSGAGRPTATASSSPAGAASGGGPPASSGPSAATPGGTPATSRGGKPTPSTGPAGAGAAAPGPAPAGGPQPVVLTDPAGDTFADGTHKPLAEPRADIVRAAAVYGPDAITLTLQVRQPTDPRQDARWASDSTYVAWEVDTNGDGVPDYEVQYYLDGGAITGEVGRPGDAAGPTLCDASAAGYGADGYWATVPAACLGNPAAFTFQATIYYDLNPKDDNGDVASDAAPDSGRSPPVTRPAR